MVGQVFARVLIIGNSLTAANDLPGMIEAVAAAARPAIVIECATIALPNYGLEEHWNDGRALQAIRRGGWTHVILQQGPTSLPESRRVLIEFTRKFAPHVRAQGAALLLYGVWPEAARRQAFDAVSASYAAAADDVRGEAVLVGGAWQRAWQEDPSLAFYGPDGFHPSPLGTYVAAVMLVEAISGKPATALPRPTAKSAAALRPLASVDDGQITAVHKAASAARRGKPPH